MRASRDFPKVKSWGYYKVVSRYRKTAHEYLDLLWQYGGMKRSVVYDELAEYMGTDRLKTHISQFDIKQCKKAEQFAREKIRSWTESVEVTK